MSIESNVSGHWTQEELIRELYGLGPQNGHAAQCPDCQSRLERLRAARQNVERSAGLPDDNVSFDQLAAQRRRIYARLTERQAWWAGAPSRRWAAGCAALLLLAGGIARYEQARHPAPAPGTVSDAQLAMDVSQLSQDGESNSIAPLQALFEE